MRPLPERIAMSNYDGSCGRLDYNDFNVYICTDPSCDGFDCHGINH